MAKRIEKNIQNIFQLNDYLGLALVALYLCVHFIKDNGAIDVIGPHWLYVSAINFFTLIFLYFFKEKYAQNISAVVKSPTTIVYLLFISWAACSYVYAINTNEVLVCFVRLLTTFIAFVNISILTRNKETYFRIIGIMILSVLAWESISTIKTFFDGINSGDINQVILSASGNTGNKNIIAASIAIKIPLAIYFLHREKLYTRILSMIVLCLAFYALFILNARATFVGIGLLTILYFIYLISSKADGKRALSKYKPLVYFITCLFAALLLSIITFDNIESKNDFKGGYTNPIERIGTIAFTQQGSGRTSLWGFAFDYFKHHPLLGAGYGNWKLASIPYEKYYSDDFIVAYHCHNDFLEISAELGFVGLILYILIYLTILYSHANRIFKSNYNSEQKLISAIGIFCLAAYFIDAFFNFPNERTIMQMNFALLASFIFIIPESVEEKSQFSIKTYLLPATLASLLCIAINNQVFDSMKGQRLFYADMNKDISQIQKFEYDFPAYPQLSFNTIPIQAVMSRYEFKNGNVETAIRMLDKASIQNPYIHYSESAKAAMYYRTNNPDSGYKYAKLAFQLKPRLFSAYKNWLYASVQKSDTSAIDTSFLTYKKYRNEPRAWIEYFNANLALRRSSRERLISLVNSAVKLFPDSLNAFENARKMLQLPNNSGVQTTPKVSEEQLKIAQSSLAEAVNYFNQKQYLLAAKKYLITASIDVTNYTHFENAGICYYVTSNFEEAIKYFSREIGLGGDAAAKSYYYKGVSLISKGNQDLGCGNIKIAMSKGFLGDSTFNSLNCNF